MNPEQERTYNDLRSDYGYAEVIWRPGGVVEVDFYDLPSDGRPIATITIDPEGNWS